MVHKKPNFSIDWLQRILNSREYNIGDMNIHIEKPTQLQKRHEEFIQTH